MIPHSQLQGVQSQTSTPRNSMKNLISYSQSRKASISTELQSLPFKSLPGLNRVLRRGNEGPFEKLAIGSISAINN